MPEIAIENLNLGFVEAIRVFGQYLTENREWGWGPAAAQYLFRDDRELGLEQDPQRAPTEEEFRALAAVAALQERLARGGALRPGDEQVFQRQLEIAEAYLQNALGVGIDRGQGDAVVRPQRLSDLVGQVDAGAQVFPVPNRRPDPTYWDRNGAGEVVRPDVTGRNDLRDDYFAPPPPEQDLRAEFGEPPAPPAVDGEP